MEEKISGIENKGYESDYEPSTIPDNSFYQLQHPVGNETKIGNNGNCEILNENIPIAGQGKQSTDNNPTQEAANESQDKSTITINIACTRDYTQKEADEIIVIHDSQMKPNESGEVMKNDELNDDGVRFKLSGLVFRSVREKTVKNILKRRYSHDINMKDLESFCGLNRKLKMVRNYERITANASYPKEKLIEAVNAVKSGRMNGDEAKVHYGIPRATIMNRVYGRRGLKSNTLGRPPVLLPEVEKDLVNNLRIMEKYGFGLTRKELLEIVGEYVSFNLIKNPFKNGVPGEDWFLEFKKRHNLSIKKPQPVGYARKQACSPYIIYPYFDLLEKTINELGLSDKPSHIWNVDETRFSKDPCKSKVVGYKRFTATRTITSPRKDNTTVLLGCNALGEKTPPMIVYKGKNVWDQWTTDDGYPGTAYAATSNGWMETSVFKAFFEKVFLKTIGQKRPILLLYDGHATHVGVNLIKKARDANITILKIPPHTSHLLQPLELAVNKSFKDRWDSALVKWQRMNKGKQLPKKEFAKLIGKIWGELDMAICSAGFQKAGIYPFNKNAVSEDNFNQTVLQTWKRNIASDSTFVENQTTQPLDLQEPRPGTSKQTFPLLKEITHIPPQQKNPDSLVIFSLRKVNSMLTQTTKSNTISKAKPQIAKRSEKIKIEKRKKKPSVKSAKRLKYSTSESETEIKYDEDSDGIDADFWEKFLQGNDDYTDASLDKENVDTNLSSTHLSSSCKNDWLLVKFCLKKSTKHYVGLVLKTTNDGFPVVKYARKKSKSEYETIFTFPIIEDISVIKNAEDIVAKLPDPAIGRRGHIAFKMNFNSYNIQ